MKKITLPILILAIISLTSCLKDKVSPFGCDTIISYEFEIRPIIESSCKTGLGGGTGCHDAWIDDYSQVQSQLNSGNWQNEVLVEKTMPISPNLFGIDSLTNDEYQTMRCWILQGYPEN
ncbi:MAG: hypothetical protein GQ574_27590 [Crocinitomix sp.]|nr:hypothetical protein [Crocinitomix sp.]